MECADLSFRRRGPVAAPFAYESGHDDLSVQEQRLQRNIARVPVCQSFRVAHIDIVDLGKAADAGFDGKDATGLARLKKRRLHRQAGARADQADLIAQDVPDLWQFIDLATRQEMPNPCDGGGGDFMGPRHYRMLHALDACSGLNEPVRAMPAFFAEGFGATGSDQLAKISKTECSVRARALHSLFRLKLGLAQ